MKKITVLLLLFISLKSASAQDPVVPAVPDLLQINTAAKNTYIKTESLDVLQQQLRYFDEHPVTGKDQQQLLLETYRAVTNGYSINNHFKQGYVVFQKYLSMKEGFLAMEKAEVIKKMNQNIANQEKSDGDAFVSIQNSVQQLQTDNENLVSKRKSFKHYFSLGIIALTVIFAFLLLQAAVKLNKTRHDLKTGRERLMTIHRVAVLGRLKDGASAAILTILRNIHTLAGESITLLDQPGVLAAEKNNETARVRKQLTVLQKHIENEIHE
ncbi:MAG: hypothetical protein NT126_08920 [Bacteroidetes bacterium]|nr:hypothetical protein [Bacteroidota bacterium]